MTSRGTENYVIIGLSGVSGGGKTTLATRLERELSKTTTRVETLRLDAYFWKDKSRISFNPLLKCRDYERPGCIDFDRFLEDVMKIVDSFARNPVAPPPCDQILILDGFLLFADARILSLCHLRYDFRLPYAVAKQRREGRDYPVADKPGYFDRAVWPGFLRYQKLVSSRHQGTRPVIVVDGTQHPALIFGEVFNDFRRIAFRRPIPVWKRRSL